MVKIQTQYVQYGCGFCAPTSWRNFDASPTLRIQKMPLVGELFSGGRFPDFPRNVEYGDIVKGLPISPDSCKAVYCSHVLEHLSLADFRRALNNTIFYLQHNGIFRFVIPDLYHLAEEYVRSEATDAATTFIRKSGLGREKRPRGIEGLLRQWLGNSNHLWGWDFRSAAFELEKVGFREIRRAAFGDSEYPQFKDVEDASRWQNCLGVECRK
jgi:hypothetical protein